MAIRKQDQPNTTTLGNSFINQLNSVLFPENLKFINQITNTSKDTGFNIFFNHREIVNQALGPSVAEGKIKKVIADEEIEPALSNAQNEPV